MPKKNYAMAKKSCRNYFKTRRVQRTPENLSLRIEMRGEDEFRWASKWDRNKVAEEARKEGSRSQGRH